MNSPYSCTLGKAVMGMIEGANQKVLLCQKELDLRTRNILKKYPFCFLFSTQEEPNGMLPPPGKALTSRTSSV